MKIRKAKKKDLDNVRRILGQWVDEEQTDTYVKRFEDEINGKTEYGMRFWVVEYENEVVGACGLADPLPISLKFSCGKKPIEIKILYLDNTKRGLGIGKKVIVFLEETAKRNGYDEILIRSANEFEKTAYGFYEKMGYKLVGHFENDMAVFRKTGIDLKNW